MSSQRSENVSEGVRTRLGKTMHETCIVPCSIHYSDHDDLLDFYRKMNDEEKRLIKQGRRPLAAIENSHGFSKIR